MCIYIICNIQANTMYRSDHPTSPEIGQVGTSLIILSEKQWRIKPQAATRIVTSGIHDILMENIWDIFQSLLRKILVLTCFMGKSSNSIGHYLWHDKLQGYNPHSLNLRIWFLWCFYKYLQAAEHTIRTINVCYLRNYDQ